jgi:hypothetical protein
MPDAATIAEACDRELPLQGARLGDEYLYQSLPLCVIDAVFSIGVRYQGVRNIVERYCSYFSLQKFRNPPEQVPPREQQEALSTLIAHFGTPSPEQFSRKIFNKQRTSSRNGILKSEAVWRFAKVLNERGINFLQDIPQRVADSELESALRRVPGQASGISIRYFFMLAGSDELVKPDRWIGRFLERHLGYTPSAAEAQSLIAGACQKLRTKYPQLVPRLLDNVIWNYESKR